MPSKIKTVKVSITKTDTETVFKLSLTEKTVDKPKIYQLAFPNVSDKQQAICSRIVLAQLFRDQQPTNAIFDFICSSAEDEKSINHIFDEINNHAKVFWRKNNKLENDYLSWIELYALVKTNTILTRVV